MADPLSIAGLGIGVVALGLQVSGAIFDYVDALDHRGDELTSLKQQNSLLRKTLGVIEASLSQFQHGHQVTIAAVHECLKSCNKELNALEALATGLIGSGSTSSRKEGLKMQGKRLLYPFERPNIEQLEKRMSSTNVTLQLALEMLQL